MKLREAIPDEPFIATYSGRHLLLRCPDPAQIDIQDIAHGLAYQGCLNGQTQSYYSLAQRSLLVARLLPIQHRLAGLLHDAPSAYLGDLGASWQQLIPDYPQICHGILAAIGEKFSVSGFDNPSIQRARQVAQETERRDVHGTQPPGRAGSSRPVPVPRRIECLSPDEAMAEFLAMFNELYKKPAASAGRTPARLGTPRPSQIVRVSSLGSWGGLHP